MAEIHSKLMGLLARVPYVRCEDVNREYAVNWLMNNGVTVQKWIPVTKQLPKEWEAVLVWSCCGFCEVAVYLGTPGKWRVCWNHAMLDEDTVTHWMPLPEPPKEVDHGQA